MAAPQPDDNLPRPFEVEAAYNKGFMTETERDDLIANLEGEIIAAGRTNGCPKCGATGFIYINQALPDEYKTRCDAVDQADPTNDCRGWGFTVTSMHAQIVPNVYTSA